MSSIRLTVNGRSREVDVDDSTVLLDALRDGVGVTSVREGCGVGACGACTVLVDGTSVSSCLANAGRYEGRQICTADGLSPDDEVVAAFVESNAMQCGYCIPGMVLMTKELLAENPDPTDEEITHHLEGNICRSGTYLEIRAAVHEAARRLRA
jgi:aerobic-type carbon monoxide dehydrogenase small subunit (CoxS/CutS family)